MGCERKAWSRRQAWTLDWRRDLSDELACFAGGFRCLRPPDGYFFMVVSLSSLVFETPAPSSVVSQTGRGALRRPWLPSLWILQNKGPATADGARGLLIAASTAHKLPIKISCGNC